MRYAILVCLVFVSHLAHCQFISFSGSNEGFSFKADDCRFKAGDSLTWAQPAYNAKSWDTFDDTPEQRTALLKAKTGWFRYSLQGNKRYKERAWDLIIQQLGDSKIYFDGKLIATVVADRRSSTDNRMAFEPIPVMLPDTGKHVLAIRFQYQDEDLLFANTSLEPFRIWIEPRQLTLVNLTANASVNAAVGALIAGIFVILALLHLMFFRANPEQKVNGLLSISSVSFALMFGVSVFEYHNANLRGQSVIDLIQYAGLHIGAGCLLMAVYAYLQRAKGWIFAISITLLTISFGYQWLVGSLPSGLAALTSTFFAFDYIRTSWLGKKRGQAGDKLPWNSLRFSFISFLLATVLSLVNGIMAGFYDWDFNNLMFLLIIILLFFLFLLSVPIGLSFSLVQDYTRTHTSLQKNLDEVKRLSERSLAQEQEKQQILAAQNETLERLVQERTAALNESIETLKATQDQLIQKEKMASLGELTAGIAHEIQNPLNFVNNFSEVSADLVAEIEDERQRPADDRDEGLVDEILGDLRQNLEKITHHGKRASSIVKGMLEHSRTSSGEKQPTDLNALGDEYLRLAYHGYRAAHKTFNCQLVTDFDPTLPLVNLATQDIGRVVLNLLNNAFYALDQKQQSAPAGFQPTVWVSTHVSASGGSQTAPAAGRAPTTANTPDFVTLVIRDNGPGIPEDVIGKVFQPFFTTKPTGEGTGLGLSLSFDIITKGHQGDFFVDSTDGEGTTFTIKLPI